MADNQDSNTPMERAPWEQLTGEPDRWFARFDGYRLLGPGRTLERAYRDDTGRTRPATGEWKKQAARWRWRERASAWDEATRRQRQEARLAHLARLEEEHVALGLLCIEKARERLNAIQVEELTPAEALRLLLAGAQLRREALIEPAVEENERRLGEIQARIDTITRGTPEDLNHKGEHP